jgi:hypothetical protein
MDVSEAGDIFMGGPAGTALVPDKGSSGAAPGAAPPYTIDGVVGLLRYLLTLAAFFPAPARQLFNEQDSERRIKGLADSLSWLEGEGPRAIPGPAASGPKGDRISITSLTGLLRRLGELAQDLPQAEQRDILKQKVENIIEGLDAAILK